MEHPCVKEVKSLITLTKAIALRPSGDPQRGSCNHSVGLEPAGLKPHDYNNIVFATPVGGGRRVCEPSCAGDPLQGSVN